MAIIKCKMCGGNLELTEGSSLAECEYCGTKQTVPAADNEKKLTLFARANRLRSGCEFDKAAGIYETIVADFPEEAEAYWGLVLCRYGIEYVDDPATGRKIPTCHRSSFDSVLEDADFDQVMENADPLARRVYREEAKQIEELRRGIISVSANEQPYDIFICYKETDENGDRTLDSVLAQDVYDALTEKGYRVFFSRISLEDKLGTEYEPYIFAALNSARIMLAFGTDYEHYNAVWVKNEWSRYLALMASGQKKTLIPCFKNLDAYDMPREFAKLQAQDMGKVGAMQDLLRGIDKIMERGGKPEAAPAAAAPAAGGSATVDSLLERMFLFLEDGDWSSANTYCEKVLDIDPKNARAYLGKLLAEQEVRTADDLRNCEQPFDDSAYYQKVLRFGDETLRDTLVGYVTHIKDTIYGDAAAQLERAETEEQYNAAADRFAQVPGYRDADELRQKCLELAEEARKDAIYRDAVAQREHATTEVQYKEAASCFWQVSGYRDASVLHQKCLEEAKEARKAAIYRDAVAQREHARTEAQYKAAAAHFAQIRGYRDADELRQKCQEDAEEARKVTTYRDAESLMEHATTGAQYKAAADRFAEISGYRDADELRQKCLAEAEEAQKAEEARKAAIYSDAVKMLKEAQTEEACQRAVSLLGQIPGYRDADALRGRCWKVAKLIGQRDKLKRQMAKYTNILERSKIARQVAELEQELEKLR